jgi:hypothetical protein
MKNRIWEFFFGRYLVEPGRRGRVVHVSNWRTAIAVYHPGGQLRRVKLSPLDLFRW